MAKKKKFVSHIEAAHIYALYQTFGTYKEVAKKVKRSPDTVAKYVKIYEAALAGARLMENKDKYPPCQEPQRLVFKWKNPSLPFQ